MTLAYRDEDLLQMVDAGKGIVDRRMFFDEDIYQLELERIFARAWNFMCHDSQIPNTGEPVVASAPGQVAFAGTLRVRGGSVIIDHGLGIFSAYHHLSRIDVATDASVLAGQQVGLIGSTGLVTGPHLHWEIVVRGIEVDGEAWLQGTDFGL